MNVVAISLVIPFIAVAAQAQEGKPVDPIAEYSHAELEQEVLAVNEAMFNAVFETCDADAVNKLFHENNEFYHDQVGPVRNIDAHWLDEIEQGKCALHLIKREPIEGTYKVYPMHYFGAIVYGENRYLAKTKTGEYELEDTGKYMHLWHLKDGQWQLFRAISYDHQLPTDKTE